MRALFTALILSAFLTLHAQDKLYFVNGKTQTGVLVSMNKDIVFFKNNDTAFVRKILKKDLIMVEDYRGARYIFGNDAVKNDSLTKKTNGSFRQNALGIQPLGVLLGKAGVFYEYINRKQTVGLVIPLILTFDPVGILYNPTTDSGQVIARSARISFITGADINYYVGSGKIAKFFMGSKFRYGTDIFLGNIEYYTLQAQLGWRFGKPSGRIFQHLCFGYGFAGIVSSPIPRLVLTRNYYGIGSLTYRISYRW